MKKNLLENKGLFKGFRGARKEQGRCCFYSRRNAFYISYVILRASAYLTSWCFEK